MTIALGFVAFFVTTVALGKFFAYSVGIPAEYLRLTVFVCVTPLTFLIIYLEADLIRAAAPKEKGGGGNG